MAINTESLTKPRGVARAGQPLITVRDVHRTFTVNGREVQPLRGVDLDVHKGELVVLMGPSGSGKTTLLNILGGLDQPTAGTVTLDGQRLDQLSNRDLTAIRRRIGFIFQSFALIPTASAFENVELGLRLGRNVPRQDWDRRIRRALHAVGLTPWLHHRPYELSGGQQQRVAIARALVNRPQLILADEPTGDLDSKTGHHILSMLRSLVDHEDMTIIVATHDIATTEVATTVRYLRDGKIEGL